MLFLLCFRMPGQKDHNFECVLCSKRTRQKERRKCNKAIQAFFSKCLFVNSTDNDIICNKCRHKYYNDIQKSNSQCTADSNSTGDEYGDEYTPPKRKQKITGSPPSVSLPIKSTTKSHAYCFICRKPGPRLVVIPSEIRTRVLIFQNVWIPEGSRCCPSHIQDADLSEHVLQNIKTTNDNSYLSRTTITDILKRLREICIRQNRVRFDFDNPGSLQEHEYVELTGLTRAHFNDLFKTVEHSIKNTPSRSQRCSLAIFLCKMRNGLSNKLLATLFNISKYSIRRAISTVRSALMQNFVPYHLGFQHISRESVINDHTRRLAQSLLGDFGFPKAILVLDGTYIYIEKSNNFNFQRRSYSLHKGRPLIKPMVITTTSGYFVSILGPYFADEKNNDASILTHILKSNLEDIRNWVDKDDIFIVDRGFRDSLSLLEDLGIKAEMPRFLSRGDKQMSTEDANMSRLVTKVSIIDFINSTWNYMAKLTKFNELTSRIYSLYEQ